MIDKFYINIIYIVSAILFIYGLKMLSNQKTAKKGNMVSSLGMLIAVIAALITFTKISLMWIVVGVVAGALVGAVAAKKVEMTKMPEMVALFNGFGGLASLLVGYSEFVKGEPSELSLFSLSIIIITIFVGAITFSGSFVAWAKLAGKISARPIIYSGQKAVNLLLLVVLIVLSLMFLPLGIGSFDPDLLLPIITVLCLVLGITFVIPIGGGDMPVVISLLNSFSGMAAAAAGFVISNTVLIVAGALVGSSGVILTVIMCKSMNRKLQNVLFSGFGSVSTSASSSEVQGEVDPVNAEDLYLMLEAANNVLIVPGYGMAVAQAQHAVQELASILSDNGSEVNFAIHPVAGRMPGHMNVLLAEANVEYELLKEMDDVNPVIENVDIAIVIGANDVVNPDAKNNEGSPIYGMPVINVDKARTVIVLKRSMSPGFAGIENPLFYMENTRMLFGDAKESLQKVIAEFK